MATSYFGGLYPIHNTDILLEGLNPSIPNSNRELREKAYQKQLEEERAEEEVGFLGGIEHSALGTIAKVRMLSSNPLGEAKTYIPTDEERDKILDAFDYNEDAYRAVVKRLNSADDIDNTISVVKENIEYNKMESKAGMLDVLASGIGDALVDPVNWATAGATGAVASMFKLSGKVALGFRVGSGGASNALSGWQRESITGVESDMMMDALAGMAFGYGAEVLPDMMSAASRKFFAKLFRETYSNKNNFASEAQPALTYFENSNVLRKFRTSMFSLGEHLRDGLRFTVNDMFNDVSPEGQIRTILNNYVKNEAGVKDEFGIHRQVGTINKTAEEFLRDSDDQLYRLAEARQKVVNKMSLKGISGDEISDGFYKVLSGKELPEKLQPFAGEISGLAKQYRQLLDDDNLNMIFIGKWEKGAIDASYYVPRVWDVYKIADKLRTYGGTTKDALQALGQRLAHLTYEGTKRNARALEDMHKAYTLRLQDDFKPTKEGEELVVPDINSPEFHEWMMKEATEFALGVVDQGKHIKSVFDPRNPLSSFGDGGKHRLPWDTSYVDPEDGLCLDDLRVNFFDAIDRYHRRATGERIAKEVFGADGYNGMQDMFNTAIRDEIDKRPVGAPDAEARYRDASDILLKKTFGIGLRDYDEGLGVGTALSEILRNLTFATANSYMGILNYTEVAAGVLAYGPSLLLKSIPGFNKVFTRWAKGGMTPSEERGVMDLLFTKEPVVKSIWGDIRRHNRYRYGDHRILADIVSGTQVVANALPTTKFLQASQVNIVDTARGMMLAQIIRGTKGGFFRKGTLARINVSNGDMVHLRRQLKKAFAVDVKDGISVRDINAITRDPRALNTLRRLGDYAADETILRPSLGDAFRWDTSASPIINMLTQFKSFAIRSWSKRFIKSLNRVQEGDGLYQAANLSVSIALATFGNLGITAIRTMGMSESDREKYWQMAMGIDLNEDMENWILPAVESSILRASPLAAIALPLNAAGIGTFAKTTSDAGLVDPDAPKLFGRISIGDAIEQNIPAFRTATNYANLGVGLANYLNISRNPEDYTYEQEQRNINNLWKSLKAVTPQWSALTNIPLDGLKDEYTDLE